MTNATAAQVSALDDLIDEIRAAFHRLKVAARDVHGGSDLAGGLRGVLHELHDEGPKTVPQMARARPVSRQHIQALINKLLERKLVELRPNPRHRRSNLVVLTHEGRTWVEGSRRRERRILAQLEPTRSATELRFAAQVVHEVAGLFHGERWQEIVLLKAGTAEGQTD